MMSNSHLRANFWLSILITTLEYSTATQFEKVRIVLIPFPFFLKCLFSFLTFLPGTAVCEAVFGLSQGSYDGPDSDSRGPVANTHYGGRSIEGINITMPNGNMDPW
jgi:hypothetical protein